LADQLSAPLTDLDAIDKRHDAIAWFVEATDVRRDLRTGLSGAPDMSRALSRVMLGRAGPRDLAALGSALDQAGLVEALLPDDLPALLQSAKTALAARPR
jgi:DNA mismatch repair protein MutS